MTVATWFDIWLEEYNSHIKPLTFASYEKDIRLHIKPQLGSTKLISLNTHNIQSFYNRLNLAPKTIKNIHVVVHKALKIAVELGYLRANPASFCKLPKVIKPEIKPLDEDSTRLLIARISGHKYEHMFIIDLFTGLRLGELMGLPWKCVDFKTGIITISQQLQLIDSEYMIVPPKHDKIRFVSPAPYVMQILKEQRIIQSKLRLKAGSLWNNQFDLVFTKEDGTNCARQTVRENFKRIVSSIGLPETRIHDLRHSYAVASIIAGDDIKTVQENLGHHTAAFTLDTYAHVTEQMKKDSSNRMQNYIESLK